MKIRWNYWLKSININYLWSNHRLFKFQLKKTNGNHYFDFIQLCIVCKFWILLFFNKLTCVHIHCIQFKRTALPYKCLIYIFLLSSMHVLTLTVQTTNTTKINSIVKCMHHIPFHSEILTCKCSFTSIYYIKCIEFVKK